jgi:predicted transcriptional regulator
LEGASELLHLLSDEKCIDILEAIQDSSLSITNLKLNRKQFYSRLYNMKQFGLIEKAKGDFVLTIFGRIVFHYHLVLRDMIDEHWKFKAFDHLFASDIPESELAAIRGTLFESKIIKQFLSK